MNLREAIRDQLGVREVHGTNEWPCKCFSPEHDDARPSASVNVDKGLWVCYSCGRGGTVLDLLDGQISDPSVPEFLDCIESNLRLAEQLGHSDASHYTESWLKIFTTRRAHAYWTEARSFTPETVAFFSLGYDFESDCCTYPIRDVDGSVLGVVRRKLDDSKPKYLYPKGVNVHDLLFRYHEAPYGDTIVLVEGALDAVALHEAGVFAMGIYGSRLSAVQEHLVIRLNPRVVICAFDNDDAGRMVMQQVVDTDISLISQVKTVNWSTYEAKDVAELVPEQRRRIIEEAVDTA